MKKNYSFQLDFAARIYLCGKFLYTPAFRCRAVFITAGCAGVKGRKMNKTSISTKRLVESAVMVAFATVLSMLKLVDMPYGGSVTAASMLPIAIISYRHGIGTGLGAGLVYAVIQQLLGLNTLSYVTGWQSIVAVIVLDYALAFALVGLAGMFKGKLSSKISLPSEAQSVELAVGTLAVCVFRYICHTVAGATVWAGLSIPNEAAIIYSLGYNATYMIPEAIVTTLAAAWIGSILDLSKNTPVRFTGEGVSRGSKDGTCEILKHIFALIFVFVIAFDTVIIAPYLQNEESGEFDFSGLSSAPWITVAIVSAVCVLAMAAVYVARRILIKRAAEGK
ncbi:MAG: hypothetical protein E7673_00465 [Ruminococcaceae bacterium]|nr:hypothetical protein [Oscillospiraceae bacterium]